MKPAAPPAPGAPRANPSPESGDLGSKRPASGTRTSGTVSYALRDGQHEMLLAPGETLLGRSSECTLILDGALVSRRHAIITLADDRLTLRDLDSRNGTYVNGQRVVGEVKLDPADRLLVGNVELSLIRREVANEQASHELRRALTVTVSAVRDSDPVPHPDSTPPEDAGPDEGTRTGHTFELLAGVVDKALVLGHAAEAIRILTGPIDRVWRDVRSGRKVASQLADSAADYAVRLAEVTSDEAWVTKALQIFMALERPLPLPVIDRLYGLLRRLPSGSHSTLDHYVKSLQARRDGLSAAERFALSRLEGLVRVATR